MNKVPAIIGIAATFFGALSCERHDEKENGSAIEVEVKVGKMCEEVGRRFDNLLNIYLVREEVDKNINKYISLMKEEFFALLAVYKLVFGQDYDGFRPNFEVVDGNYMLFDLTRVEDFLQSLVGKISLKVDSMSDRELLPHGQSLLVFYDGIKTFQNKRIKLMAVMNEQINALIEIEESDSVSDKDRALIGVSLSKIDSQIKDLVARNRRFGCFDK